VLQKHTPDRNRLQALGDEWSLHDLAFRTNNDREQLSLAGTEAERDATATVGRVRDTRPLMITLPAMATRDWLGNHDNDHLMIEIGYFEWLIDSLCVWH